MYFAPMKSGSQHTQHIKGAPFLYAQQCIKNALMSCQDDFEALQTAQQKVRGVQVAQRLPSGCCVTHLVVMSSSG